MIWVDKTRRLANIHAAINVPIQKDRADVQRINMVPLVGRDTQQQPKAGSIRLGEIYSILLGITLSNTPGFVFDKAPISVELLRENPPSANWPITLAPGGRSVKL